MTKSRCVLFALPLLIASCSGPMTQFEVTAPTGTTLGQLTSLYQRAPVKFSKARVSCVLEGPGTKQTLPSLVLRAGGRAKTTAGPVRELVYPTEFDFAEVPETVDPRQIGFPITPAHPRKFTNFDQGWTLTLSAKPRGSFVVLSGKLTQARIGRFVQAAGKPYEPMVAGARTMLGRPAKVVLSENRAEQPSIIREEIPIMIAADPGNTYRIQLDDEGTQFAEFRCEIE